MCALNSAAHDPAVYPLTGTISHVQGNGKEHEGRATGKLCVRTYRTEAYKKKILRHVK